MRRALFLCTLPLLIAGCSRPSALPSTEVLRRSATASQTLASASFNGNGTLSMANESTKQQYQIDAQGALQNGGRQVELNLKVNGSIVSANQTYNLGGDLSVISLSRSEVYMRLQNVHSQPEYPLLSGTLLKEFIGQWWLLTGSGSSDAAADQVSPDPNLLKLQSEVVNVTADHGIQRRDGHDVYVYDVTLNPQGLQQFLQHLTTGTDAGIKQTQEFFDQYRATGSLEIDATTFYVRRVAWKLTPKRDGPDHMEAAFDVTFRDQNSAPRIQAPAGAKPFRSTLTLPSRGTASSLSSSQR